MASGDREAMADERGGVLGAMERQYQRGKIQDESLKYEHLKHSGELPIVGVNTFQNTEKTGEQEAAGLALTRADSGEKHAQITRLRDFQARHAEAAELHAAHALGDALARPGVDDVGVLQAHGMAPGVGAGVDEWGHSWRCLDSDKVVETRFNVH